MSHGGEGCECYGFGDLAENRLGDARDFAQDEIQRAAVHVLHTDVNLAVRIERAVESHNIRGVAFVEDS